MRGNCCQTLFGESWEDGFVIDGWIFQGLQCKFAYLRFMSENNMSSKLQQCHVTVWKDQWSQLHQAVLLMPNMWPHWKNVWNSTIGESTDERCWPFIEVAIAAEVGSISTASMLPSKDNAKHESVRQWLWRRVELLKFQMLSPWVTWLVKIPDRGIVSKSGVPWFP